jgi:hypothetical protein
MVVQSINLTIRSESVNRTLRLGPTPHAAGRVASGRADEHLAHDRERLEVPDHELATGAGDPVATRYTRTSTTGVFP